MSKALFNYHRMSEIFGADRAAAFEEPAEQQRVWGASWGCDNDVGRLRAVLVHRPGREWEVIDANWPMADFDGYGDARAGWYWAHRELPDIGAMQAQHDGLVALLRAEGVDVVEVANRPAHLLKLCYTRDSMIAVKGGAIVCRMGPKVRRPEALPVSRTLAELGVPILRTLNGEALMEGGSFAWINSETAVVGLGERCNEAGARQIEEVLNEQGATLLRVALNGFELHIDGGFVMIDRDKALVNPTRISHWFLMKLRELGVEPIAIAADDPPFTANCLAVAPGRIIMSGVSDGTRRRLEANGVEILELPYQAVYAGGGGIHCSTSPLRRDPI